MPIAKLQPGRKAIESLPEITNIRPVERADLAHLNTKRPPNSLQSLRDNHHRIARAVAGGMSNGDVAATCGVSINRVSMLKQDPSFTELVAHYRAILTAEWAQEDTVVQFLRNNALKAQAMIADKLEDAEAKNEFLPTRDLVAISELGLDRTGYEFLPTRDLVAISELGLDRTGYGKVNKNLNINVDFAAKLEGMRNRSKQAAAKRSTTTTPASTHITIEGELAPTLAPRSEPVANRPPASSPPAPSFRRI